MSTGAPVSRSLRIVVLAGGDSSERDISLDSGSEVTTALKQRGHKVLQIDPSILALHEIPWNTDVILPLLHGTGGEDGSLQRRLDWLGIPWLGSSAAASETTFDKVATRKILADAGLPLPPGTALPCNLSLAAKRSASKKIGYPQVVKPAAQGSSVGISIVDAAKEFDAAAAEAARWGTMFLIEKFIAGREVTVPVVNGLAFPAVEIVPQTRWYDYSAKYTDEKTQYHVAPMDLPPQLDKIVLAACEVCGVQSISRTDLRIDAAGNPFILEINTIPGMTSHSLVPMSARALGISVGDLYEQLVLERLGRISAPSWARRFTHSTARDAA